MTDTAPAPAPVADRPVTEESAQRAFSISVAVSAVRCTLSYVVFPWLLPLVGAAGGVGPALGVAIGVVAIAANVMSIRRFHRADHRWKWAITTLNLAVIALLVVLIGGDLADLSG